jgi:hypothetical protein
VLYRRPAAMVQHMLLLGRGWQRVVAGCPGRSVAGQAMLMRPPLAAPPGCSTVWATSRASVRCQAAAHLPRQGGGGARSGARRAFATSTVSLESERLCSATPPSSATLSSGRLRVAVDVDEGEMRRQEAAHGVGQEPQSCTAHIPWISRACCLAAVQSG